MSVVSATFLSSSAPITTPTTAPTSDPITTPTSVPGTTTPTSTTPISLSSTSTTSSTSSTSTTSSFSSSDSTTTTTGSSIAPTTEVVTSLQVVSPTQASQPLSTETVVVPRSTSTPGATSNTRSTASSTGPTSSSSSSAGLPVDGKSSSGGGGLSSAGTTAIAVVIPVVVVALLLILGIFFWRRRKQRKTNKEERRKEVEEYGYNPNDDPTLPAVGGIVGQPSPEMSEDTGYRGWGNTTNGTASARKPSTHLSSGVGAAGIGMAVSDDGHGSPGTHPSERAQSGDPLMDGAIGSSALPVGAAAGAGAGAGVSGAFATDPVGVNRGPSNASSTYSAAGRTDGSGDGLGNEQDRTYDSNYSQYTPYHPGNTGYSDALGGQPVIKDVSARRNTKIETAGYAPPGNSGIAQNF